MVGGDQNPQLPPAVLMGSLVKCTAYKRMLKKCAAHVRGWTLWLDFRVFIRVTFTSFSSDNIAHHESSPRLTNSKCTWLEGNACGLYISTTRTALAYLPEGMADQSSRTAMSLNDTELRRKSRDGESKIMKDPLICQNQVETFGALQENT